MINGLKKANILFGKTVKIRKEKKMLYEYKNVILIINNVL